MALAAARTKPLPINFDLLFTVYYPDYAVFTYII
jgi:hypothetical protein